MMQGHELMKNHSRGTYLVWRDKIVNAVQRDAKADHQTDTIECIENATETIIQLDMSLQPTVNAIKDAQGTITGWTPINPLEKLAWERETGKYDKRALAYETNKQVACGIIMDSIEPYYVEKLEQQVDYESNKRNLVWLLQKIKSFCSYDTDEQDTTLTVIDSQMDFLHFKQGSQSLTNYKRIFKQKFDALKDNKMSLGAVEAITSKMTSGTAPKKAEAAV